MRITNNITDIPVKDRYRAITNYLANIYNRKEKEDFIFDIIRYTDSINHYSSDRNILSRDSTLSPNLEKYDEELSNNILLRSLDEIKIPFHCCKISRLTIKECINKLTVQSFVIINLIIDPDKEFIENNHRAIRKIVLENSLNSNDIYRKKKRNAINELLENIIKLNKS